jgi:hypothetical protein
VNAPKPFHRMNGDANWSCPQRVRWIEFTLIALVRFDGRRLGVTEDGLRQVTDRAEIERDLSISE